MLRTDHEGTDQAKTALFGGKAVIQVRSGVVRLELVLEGGVAGDRALGDPVGRITQIFGFNGL